MADNPNKLNKFWQELKRRKVIRVIIVYATTAFILMQLIDLIQEPFNLPNWVTIFFFVVLLVGFPIAIIFSWIFDITPQGVEVTKKADFKTVNESYGILSKKYLVFDVIIGVLLIAVIILAFPKFYNNDSGKKLEKSIAILPFRNDSPEDSTQYFMDGVMEELLTNLQKVKELRVLGRTSVEQYRDQSKSISQIAEELGVNYIIEGSGQKSGNSLRMRIQLIRARNESHIWANNFEQNDLNLKDYFRIQANFAESIASELKAAISPTEKQLIEKVPTERMEAYNNYLMGQYFCLKRDSVSIQRGLECFENAIKIDPDYTLAYAGLADAYYAQSFTGNIERSIGYDKAFKMAEKALEMDSNLAEAYAVLGVVSYFGYWKWEEAGRFFKKALEVDSDCMVAHLYYCSFLDIVGEPDEALRHANRAIELEPFYVLPYHMKGIIYRNNGNYLESIKAFSKCLELEPDARDRYNQIFLNYLSLNDEASALQTTRKIFSVNPAFQKYESEITPTYELAGMNGVLQLYLKVVNDSLHPDRRLKATLYTLLGKQNEAINYLDIECRERETDIPRIIRKPEFEVLHSNPRFLALVDTMNLSPYFPESSE